jgi:hypothetical protein
MIRAWTTCVAAVLVLGCQSGEEPVRGARVGFEPPVAYPEPVPSEPERPFPPLTPDPPTQDVLQIEATEEEPERDLDAELKAALGIPTDCVRDFVASAPTTIRISVTGIVRPTGMIIEPSAYGSGVSGAALDCVRQRVGMVVLESLDDTVSSTASAVIEIKYEPPIIVESDPGVPEPKLRNVRAPLPKRPDIPPSGKRIQEPTSKPIEGGEKTERPIEGPEPKKISGPKPRAIDGYELDENAQDWR